VFKELPNWRSPEPMTIRVGDSDETRVASYTRLDCGIPRLNPSNIVNYLIRATGNDLITSYPPQSFDWFVQMEATETWSTSTQIMKTERYSTIFLPWNHAFIPSATGMATITYSLTPGDGGKLTFYVNGQAQPNLSGNLTIQV